jgi:hypothetical protein
MPGFAEQLDVYLDDLDDHDKLRAEHACWVFACRS